MHDPMTVAFEIRSPFKRKSTLFPEGWRPPLITVWHVDPQTDGTDDSCGWFKRPRHGKEEILARIRRDLATEWIDGPGRWFNQDGSPRYSAQAMGLMMFRRAAWVYFNEDWGRTEAFLRHNLYGILDFAENNVDSLHDAYTQKCLDPVPRDWRIEHTARVLYGWILWADQRWWHHPRWHVHHWRIQIHPLQDLKRWLFSRCCVCGKRFPWGYGPISASWEGTGPRWFRSEANVRHHNCGGGDGRMPGMQGNGSSGEPHSSGAGS